MKMESIEFPPIIVEWSRLHVNAYDYNKYYKLDSISGEEYILIMPFCKTICNHINKPDFDAIVIHIIITEDLGNLQIGVIKDGSSNLEYLYTLEFNDCATLSDVLSKHLLPILLGGVDHLAKLINN